MKVGLILDNLFQPADSSFQKLRLMNAGIVGTLFTQGTKHRRWIFDWCERELDRPEYVVRIGGHYQTTDEWRSDAYAAWGEIPTEARSRTVFTFGNEPNIEGWLNDPVGYGRAYAVVCNRTPVPVLFACPSLGVDGWGLWLGRALEAAGKPQYGIVNLYAGNVGRINDFIGIFPELWVGEVNSAPEVQGQPRIDFLRNAFRTLERARVKAALVFIAGGQSHGSWDERYIISEDEARGLAGWEGDMPDEAIAVQLRRLADQNALITEGFKQILQGKFTGADGLAGTVVALQGGQPLSFEVTFPPKE